LNLRGLGLAHLDLHIRTKGKAASVPHGLLVIHVDSGEAGCKTGNRQTSTDYNPQLQRCNWEQNACPNVQAEQNGVSSKSI